MKFLEEKISLFENENKKLRMLVEVASTTTTTPVSTVKAAKEYTSSVSTNQPLFRAPTYGGNFGAKKNITYRAAPSFSGGLEPDTGTSEPQPPQPPQLPTGPDYNGDGVVDGADLGIFNAYYGQPGFDGAALGALLSAMGGPSSGGGGEPPSPPPPTSPFQQFLQRRSGTSTKDVASLAGSRYASYT